MKHFLFLRHPLNRCSFRDNWVWNFNLCTCFRCNKQTASKFFLIKIDFFLKKWKYDIKCTILAENQSIKARFSLERARFLCRLHENSTIFVTVITPSRNLVGSSFTTHVKAGDLLQNFYINIYSKFLLQ